MASSIMSHQASHSKLAAANPEIYATLHEEIRNEGFTFVPKIESPTTAQPWLRPPQEQVLGAAPPETDPHPDRDQGDYVAYDNSEIEGLQLAVNIHLVGSALQQMSVLRFESRLLDECFGGLGHF